MNVHYNNRASSYIIITSFLLLGGMIVCLDYFNTQEWTNRLWLFCSLAPLFLIAYRQRPNKGYHNPPSRYLLVAKSVLIGLQYITIIVVTFLLGLIFPDYSPVYFVNDALLFLPLFLLLLPFYVSFVSRRVDVSQDDYARICQMYRSKVIDWGVLKDFLLKSLVKIIFIPFMYHGTLVNMSILSNTPLVHDNKSFSLLFFNIIITFDMLIAVFGYLMNSALINNQIKDTDSNFLGWVFALLCYPPLYAISLKINHQPELVWYDLIEYGSGLYYLWLVIVNLLWLGYLLPTIEFGMTFSNLSYRKLINTGIYRYFKHPAYLFKNMYWWMFHVPFLTSTFLSIEWWQNMLGLTYVSMLYYGRAKSEERHLKKFPEYLEYCKYVGLFKKHKYKRELL